MDISVQLVKQHCARYFDNYTACVDKFPYTWHLDCEIQKVKLNHCAEGHPTLKKIKYGCVEPFEQYDECVNKHPTRPEQCTDLLTAFKQCAQKFYTAEVFVLCADDDRCVRPYNDDEGLHLCVEIMNIQFDFF